MILKLSSVEVFLVYQIISPNINDLWSLFLFFFLFYLLPFLLFIFTYCDYFRRFVFYCCTDRIHLLLIVQLLVWYWQFCEKFQCWWINISTLVIDLFQVYDCFWLMRNLTSFHWFLKMCLPGLCHQVIFIRRLLSLIREKLVTFALL